MPNPPRSVPPDVTIRLLEPTDSIEELTEVLHRAFKSLADMGLHFTAVDQSPQVTRQVIKDAECYVAVLKGRIVGTCTFKCKKTDQTTGSPWLDHPDVVSHTQLAVDPDLPAMGIARALHDVIEDRARELGATEIALDTAENAKHLVRLYQWSGYRIVDTAYAVHTNYRSVVMSKRLREDRSVQIKERCRACRHFHQRLRRAAWRLRARYRKAKGR